MKLRYLVVALLLGAVYATAPLGTAAAAAPVVTISPKHVNCPAQPVGAGPVDCEQIAIRTDGPQIQLGTNAVDGDGADFGNLGACNGIFVSPGQSCAINVTFHPTATGHRSATLRVVRTGTGDTFLGKVGIAGKGT